MLLSIVILILLTNMFLNDFYGQFGLFLGNYLGACFMFLFIYYLVISCLFYLLACSDMFGDEIDALALILANDQGQLDLLRLPFSFQLSFFSSFYVTMHFQSLCFTIGAHLMYYYVLVTFELMLLSYFRQLPQC